MELLIDTCICFFQGAVKATVNSINKRVNELTHHHANELASLKIHHGRQMMKSEQISLPNSLKSFLISRCYLNSLRQNVENIRNAMEVSAERLWAAGGEVNRRVD